MIPEDLEDSPEVLQVFLVSDQSRIPLSDARCIADMTEAEFCGWLSYVQWRMKNRLPI